MGKRRSEDDDGGITVPEFDEHLNSLLQPTGGGVRVRAADELDAEDHRWQEGEFDEEDLVTGAEGEEELDPFRTMRRRRQSPI